QPSLSGAGFQPELQSFTVGSLPAGATFVLRSGAQQTIQLQPGASAAAVQAALNTILGANAVSVTFTGGTQYGVTFNAVGDKTNMGAFELQNEVQSVDLSSAQATTDFSLSLLHNL